MLERLNEIKEKIKKATLKSGKLQNEVKLVAVTKKIEIERIKEAAFLGITDFGENHVQEMARKQPQLTENKSSWHMIGHLQTNKVRQAVEMACMIHSIDSIRLLEEVDKAAGKRGKIQDVLIERNIAEEMSKYGISAEEATKFAKKTCIYNNIRLRGIMCVAPFVENAEKNRVYFRKMRNLLIDIQQENKDNGFIDCLSMGMTGDYEVAVEEGATMVRIGTGIFGDR